MDGLHKLEEYIISERYAGYDPYDALTSPIFSLPVLNTNRLLRFGAQQIMKRLPIEVRPFLRTPKGRNPVTFGLCLQAFTYLQSVFPHKKELYANEAAYCLNSLQELQSKGFSGACWGYDFDWVSRYASFPAYTPTVVATGIVTNALFVHGSITGNQESLALCKSASNFIISDLRRSYEGESFCFSYSPLDSQRVLNATMKGARLLTQVYSMDHSESMKSMAKATVQYVMQHQRNNGSWPYAVGDSRKWTDNFHTGYILDCLDEYEHVTNDATARESFVKGIEYYRAHFLSEGSIPKYYDGSLYPIDSTSAAQTILTLARAGCINEAASVGRWMINNMQDSQGYFYYQQRRTRLIRTSYMRWSNAWMFLALSYLLYRQHALV